MTMNHTYLENRHNASELSDKLYMSIVAAVGTRNVSSSVILIHKVVPADVHAYNNRSELSNYTDTT